MVSPAPPTSRQGGDHEPDQVIAIARNGCSAFTGSVVRHRRNAHLSIRPSMEGQVRVSPTSGDEAQDLCYEEWPTGVKCMSRGERLRLAMA